jgi:SSS family solute:Na+ symporter
MFVGAALLVIILTAPEGGVFGIIGKISENYAVHIPEAARPSVLTIVSLVFMTSFGTWGLPQMTQKFYAIKNEAVIPKAAIVTTIFALMIGFSAYFTGASTHVFFDLASIPRNAAGGIQYDLVIPTLLTESAAKLPQLLMALILLLVLSASMSTLASLVLVSSSAIAIDLYPRNIDPKTGKDNSVAMMRFLSAIFVIFSYFISRYQLSIIVYLMSLSWGVVSGAFAAPYILGLYSKKVTKAAAYSGLFSGLIIMVALFFGFSKIGGAVGYNSPLAASIAIVVPFAVVTVVSLFTKPPDKEIVDKAFEQ